MRGQQKPQEDHGAGWEPLGLLWPFSLILLTSGAKVSQHHVVHSWNLEGLPTVEPHPSIPKRFHDTIDYRLGNITMV